MTNLEYKDKKYPKTIIYLLCNKISLPGIIYFK